MQEEKVIYMRGSLLKYEPPFEITGQDDIGPSYFPCTLNI